MEIIRGHPRGTVACPPGRPSPVSQTVTGGRGNNTRNNGRETVCVVKRGKTVRLTPQKCKITREDRHRVNVRFTGENEKSERS